jgi:hypothetical protein
MRRFCTGGALTTIHDRKRGGFTLIMKAATVPDRGLLWALNFSNTNGESSWAAWSRGGSRAGPQDEAVKHFIGCVYADYFTWVKIIAAYPALLVSRSCVYLVCRPHSTC